jgi:hypothetical protein
MLKQFTSIVFLLLANIVLLAHDVIPHHHHEENICFEHHHSCPADNSHDSEADELPPPEEKEACCMLAELVVFTPTSHSFEISCPCCEIDHHLVTFDFSFIPTYSFAGSDLSDQYPFRQKPYRINYLLSPANQLHGLRAPPLV